jgi:hypothetical protein
MWSSMVLFLTDSLSDSIMYPLSFLKLSKYELITPKNPNHLGFQFLKELLALETLNKRPKESDLWAAMAIVSLNRN